MPTWWGKSSSKDVKKKSKENIFDTINRKLNLSCDDKGRNGHVSVRKQLTVTCSKKESGSYLHPQPRSTSVPQCQSISEWSQQHSHPLPIPGSNLSRKASSNAIMDMPTTSGVTLLQPLSKHEAHTKKVYPGHVERVPELTSVYHNSRDPSEPRLLCPQTSLSKNGNRNALKDNSRTRCKDKFPVPDSKNSKEMLPTSISLNNQSFSTSPLGSATLNLWNTPHGAFGCAPDNLSPSKSPIGLFSTEHSPIPSPIMARSEPCSRIQSGSVTPLHQRAKAAAAALEFPITNYFDDKKQQSYRLPLPPLKISNCNPFPVSYSTASSPVAPRSPGRAETPRTPDSRWKKGRLIGRGTFGHVYLGFNSENGEMCAMKEVTLFSDDIKSKECAQQLVQEIKLISRLEHPNIVQYYGSDTVDDKLYIYLEYVSGGSIHKLLQDYGPLGETAIRNFTRQILCGLAYLHAKNTVHRDIKGANILVDPNGVVKLADFGMAKHINGQPCPLSLKGSPYWMAPEVIKNSSGCNLSVDIWSLGCTVLEMANGKPPWSQYEGIAAMFKIGNSKELPFIPDELGDHGKDFVKQCLQRNPENRPNAAQLLDHPFIRNATAPLERPIANHKHPEVPIAITNRVKSLVIEYDKRFSSPDSKAIPRRSKSSLRPSNSSNNIQLRNISCPVSPLTSPPLGPSRLSHSPISSPHNSPASSSVHFLQHPKPRNISCPVSPLASPPLGHSILSPYPISTPHNASGCSSFRILQHPPLRNISCPVSPQNGTPLMPSRLSHSPISSPHNAPGSNSFCILEHPQPIIYSSPRLYTNNNNLKPSSSRMSHTITSPQRNSFIPGSEFKKLPSGQSATADQVSRHLFMDDHSNSKMKTLS